MKKYVAFLVILICAMGVFYWTWPKKLTLDKVIKLSEKGENLTWGDFKRYENTDIGSGFYVLSYDIDDTFELWIVGIPNQEPCNIILVTKENTDNYVDVRTGDIEEFIETNKGNVD